MTSKETKLKIRWNKSEDDLEVIWENTPKANGNYLFSKVFNDEFQKEMIERGFDLKTIKFEIKGERMNLSETMLEMGKWLEK